MRSALLWSWAPSPIRLGHRYQKIAATAACGAACTSRSVPRVLIYALGGSEVEQTPRTLRREDGLRDTDGECTIINVVIAS